jgi:hypothetical protein
MVRSRNDASLCYDEVKRMQPMRIRLEQTPQADARARQQLDARSGAAAASYRGVAGGSYKYTDIESAAHKLHELMESVVKA